MVDETDWNGLVADNRSNEHDVEIDAVLIDKAQNGGSAPFQVRTTDGGIYWVKSLDNRQGQKVLVNEQVIARCGILIGAPVCNVACVRIPDEMNGHELSTGRALQSGIAHGSEDVAEAIFRRGAGPHDRDKDDNSSRHAGIFALYDWCWGSDNQWLYAAKRDSMTYSHDHGHYFPGGPRWAADNLRNAVDDEHPLNAPSDGINPEAIINIAERLERITRNQLVDILNRIPTSWPIPDTELETLGFFLERRCTPVANRLRDLAGGA